MSLLAKGIRYYHRNGLEATLKKSIKKCARLIRTSPLCLAETLIAPRKIELLRRAAENKSAYVIIPCIDWSIPLFQRPHQIAWELSLREDTIVFFLPDQYQYDSFCFCKKVKDNLYLYSTSLVKHLDKILAASKDVLLIMTWTRQAHLLKKIKYDKLIYDYVDEMSLFYYYDKKMEETHRYLMKEANLTLASADKLYENAKPYAKNLLLCENAGDYNFFSEQKNSEISPLIQHSVKNYKTVLGYYGCLAYWFDYETILWSASKRKDWLFILVGHIFDESAETMLLNKKTDNILYIPAQPYKSLPTFLSAFDIALVPFVINDVTLATSPVKIFEYMAAGKAILSADLPEIRKYKSVHHYKDREDFICKVEEIMAHKNHQDYIALLDKEARDNTWESRVESILREVNKQ